MTTITLHSHTPRPDHDRPSLPPSPVPQPPQCFGAVSLEAPAIPHRTPTLSLHSWHPQDPPQFPLQLAAQPLQSLFAPRQRLPPGEGGGRAWRTHHPAIVSGGVEGLGRCVVFEYRSR